MEERPRVVVVNGNASYLGGSPTWDPLRGAAPEFAFVEIDVLKCFAGSAVGETIRSAICEELPRSVAVVAYGEAAGLALEALSRAGSRVPLVLICPRVVFKETLPLRIVRALVTSGPGANLLTSISARKHRRLLADESYLRQQMSLIVSPSSISDALIAEAKRRMADPVTASGVTRAAETVRLILRSIDPATVARASKVVALVTRDIAGRYLRYGIEEKVVDGLGATMIENPESVAACLRSVVGQSRDPIS
jgi:hypothetical protein